MQWFQTYMYIAIIWTSLNKSQSSEHTPDQVKQSEEVESRHWYFWSSPCVANVQNGWEPLPSWMEKAMAPHSSTLAWEIPWMEEPGRLQSMGLQSVGHDWATSLSLFTFMHWRRKWQPTLVFLPGESQGREPGGLPSMGSHRVGHDWRGLAAAAAIMNEMGLEPVLAQVHLINIHHQVFRLRQFTDRLMQQMHFWESCKNWALGIQDWISPLLHETYSLSTVNSFR